MEDEELAKNIQAAALKLHRHISAARKAGLNVEVSFNRDANAREAGRINVLRYTYKTKNNYEIILSEGISQNSEILND